MSDTHRLDYLLFPHTTLSSRRLENLCLFLPRLEILEVISPARIPEWARERISARPAVNESEMFSRIEGCIAGYRDFAKVHGGPGGMLGYIKEALSEIDEPRYRIQEELRGKLPGANDTVEMETLKAALFLEMARELDEKELDMEAGYDRLNAIEQQFRDILGIEDEESEQLRTNLAQTLFPDESGSLYLLDKRIESWFLMLSRGPVSSMPVFVAGFSEAIDQVLDIIRTGCERKGKDFSTAAYKLGPVSLSRTEERESSRIASSCLPDLDRFLTSVLRNEDPRELEGKRLELQSAYEGLFKGEPGDAKAILNITVIKGLSCADIPGLSQPGADALAGPPIFLNVETG